VRLRLNRPIYSRFARR